VGDSVKRIHSGFPTVSVAQIKGILDWYHKHQTEADEYLEEREAENQRILQRIASTPEHIALREKLRRYQEQRIKT
jgi:hypothetical protein